MAENVILFEQPEGLPWLVAHNPATRQVAVTNALPHWASQDLADAVIGRLTAMVDRYCRRCEAIQPAVEAGEGDVTLALAPLLEHAEWCRWSSEAISRLEEACRPAGEPATPPLGHEDFGRLGDYLGALAANITDPAADC
jgi:hypothetical protein